MQERILIFSLGYLPHMVGGAEVAIKEITDRISPEMNAGHDGIVFDMITLRYDSSLPTFERIGNVNIFRIGFTKEKPTASELVQFPMYLAKVWYPIGAFFKALSLHRKNNYTAVWAMMSYMGFPALFLKTFYPKLRFILTLQEGDTIEHITERKRIRAVGFLYNQIFRWADVVQVISNYLADFARTMGYKGRIEVVPNGVDVALFSKEVSVAEINNLKEKLGKKSDDVFLVTTSRLVVKNDVGSIIDALTFLPPHVKLLVIGNGPLEQMLKDKTLALGLNERVQFLGYVPHSELPLYLAVSDIFIRPSLSEGMGNSFIEAMVAGLPVIGTAVGGITDFLKDGETGLVVAVKDSKNIAQKVEKLLKDAESRDYIVKAAKSMVMEKYDWGLIAENMEARVFKRN